jgi:hypothetical protein
LISSFVSYALAYPFPLILKRTHTLILNDADGQFFIEVFQRLGDVVVAATRLYEEDPAAITFAGVHDEARNELVSGKGGRGDDVEAGAGVLGPKAAAGHDWRDVRAGSEEEGGRQRTEDLVVEACCFCNLAHEPDLVCCVGGEEDDGKDREFDDKTHRVRNRGWRCPEEVYVLK